MVLIERTTARVIERRLFRGDLGIDLGIGMAVTRFLGFAPMGVVADLTAGFGVGFEAAEA